MKKMVFLLIFSALRANSGFEDFSRMQRVLSGMSESGLHALIETKNEPVLVFQPAVIDLLHPVRQRILDEQTMLEKPNSLVPQANFFTGWQDFVRGREASQEDEEWLTRIQDADGTALLQGLDVGPVKRKARLQTLEAMQEVLENRNQKQAFALIPGHHLLGKNLVDITCDTLKILYQKDAKAKAPYDLCALVKELGEES